MADTFTTHITFSSGDTHREDPITEDKLGFNEATTTTVDNLRSGR